jgi:hypothetical protein
VRPGPASPPWLVARAAACAAAVIALAGLAGCGYGVAAGLRLQGGVARAEVRPFVNRSSDPGLGAAVAAALREELARRRGEGPGAVIEGEVRTEGAAPTLPGGAAIRVVLEVEGRLIVQGATVATRTVRREADHLGGADALEGEARRAQALQRLSGEVARALLEALEE